MSDITKAPMNSVLLDASEVLFYVNLFAREQFHLPDLLNEPYLHSFLEAKMHGRGLGMATLQIAECI